MHATGTRANNNIMSASWYPLAACGRGGMAAQDRRGTYQAAKACQEGLEGRRPQGWTQETRRTEMDRRGLRLHAPDTSPERKQDQSPDRDKSKQIVIAENIPGDVGSNKVNFDRLQMVLVHVAGIEPVAVDAIVAMIVRRTMR